MNTNPPLRTVRLYGELARKFGRVHHFALDTNTTAEAVRALLSQYPEATSYFMGAKDRGIGFAVFRGKENLGKDQLKEPVGDNDIRIAPIITGSKRGGVFQIIAGAIIIVASAVADYVTDGAFGAATNYSTYAMGGSMIVGGVVQMLSPVPRAPKNTDSPDNKPSYVFTGAVNTQAQGNPVPLLYGRMIVGSAVISAGINAEDYAPATSGVGPGYDSGLFKITDKIFGWNPKTPYDDPPESR